MKILLNLTLISLLFPWVSFGILNLDTQPWFIIMASMFFLVNIKKKVHAVIFLSLFLFLAACGVGIGYGNFDFLFFRALLSYYAFFIVLVTYYIMKKHYDFPVLILIVSNFIWLLAGLLQAFFGKDILSMIVHVRTTDDRGVTGLAPEPTFYGIFLFFMCWLLYLEKKSIPAKIFKALFIINLLFIIFIAKSSMVILFIFIAICVYLFFNFFSIKKLIITIVCGLAIYFSIVQYGSLLEGSRVYKLMTMLIDAPLFIVAKDASMNERASHIYFSFKGFIDDLGVPHGYHSFSHTLSFGRYESSGFFWWGGNENKVMSGVGSLLFELGWFSALFFILVFWLMFSYNFFKDSMFFLCLLLGLFMSAIPIAFTLLPMIIISTYFYFIERRKQC